MINLSLLWYEIVNNGLDDAFYMYSSTRMEHYDHICFMAPECHNLYYSDLPRTKLRLERGICMDKVPEKL